MCDYAADSGGREAAMVVLDPGTPEHHGRDGVWCDPCLVPLIRALNDCGLHTRASCCGHGQYLGWVMLDDGRDLIIYPDHDSGRAAVAAPPAPDRQTRGIRFRVETACDGYAALTDTDVPDGEDVESYTRGAADAAAGIRGALGEDGVAG